MNTISIEEKEKQIKSRKFLLWLGMAGMSMAFAGLTSGYIVRRGQGNWLVFELPAMFYISTAIILLSSVTMNWALSSVKKNDSNSRTALLITLLLGLGFVLTQYLGWKELNQNNIYLTGPGQNVSGSFLFILSGLHLAHLMGGIIALVVVNINYLKNKYTSENHLGVTLCAIYWHFLDGLWVFLFLFLYFIR